MSDTDRDLRFMKLAIKEARRIGDPMAQALSLGKQASLCNLTGRNRLAYEYASKII